MSTGPRDGPGPPLQHIETFQFGRPSGAAWGYSSRSKCPLPDENNQEEQKCGKNKLSLDLPEEEEDLALGLALFTRWEQDTTPPLSSDQAVAQDSAQDAETMIREVTSQPITPDGLARVVRGLYEVLLRAEGKCIGLITNLSSRRGPFTHKQWRYFMRAHKELLNDHHDFFMASYHPDASVALREQVMEYNMPARMWKHGIWTFLDFIRSRLPESRDLIHVMMTYLNHAYLVVNSIDTSIPYLSMIWAECKAALARYIAAMQPDDLELRHRFNYVAIEEYGRKTDSEPWVGTIYYQLALARAGDTYPDFSDRFVLRLLNVTKALMVQCPCDLARAAMATLSQQMSAAAKDGEIRHFSLALSHLLRSRQPPRIRAQQGDNQSTWQHLQTFARDLQMLDEAVDMLEAPESGHQTAGQTASSESLLHPSAELATFLCHMLVLTSLDVQYDHLYMAEWAPDWATRAQRAELQALGEIGQDIYDHGMPGARLFSTVVRIVLGRADTTNVKLWEFIHVLMVFMRSLQTRPRQRARFAWAFHTGLLAPFLTMLLRDAETRGDVDYWKLSQPDFPVTRSTINRNETASEQNYTVTLREDVYLRGQFFAREEMSSNATTWAPTEQVWLEAEGEDAAGATEEARLAEAERVTALLRDPPLFPPGWFADSKYDFEERNTQQRYVQDVEMVWDRQQRTLWLAISDMARSGSGEEWDETDPFFRLVADPRGRHYFALPQAEPDQSALAGKKMPEVIHRCDRDKTIRVIYAHASVERRVEVYDERWNLHSERSRALHLAERMRDGGNHDQEQQPNVCDGACNTAAGAAQKAGKERCRPDTDGRPFAVWNQGPPQFDGPADVDNVVAFGSRGRAATMVAVEAWLTASDLDNVGGNPRAAAPTRGLHPPSTTTVVASAEQATASQLTNPTMALSKLTLDKVPKMGHKEKLKRALARNGAGGNDEDHDAWERLSDDSIPDDGKKTVWPAKRSVFSVFKRH